MERMYSDRKKCNRERNRSSFLLLLFVLCFSLVAGCSSEKGLQEQNPASNEEQQGQTPDFDEGQGETKLYCLNEERTKLISQGFHLQGRTVDEQVAELLTALEDSLWTEEERAVLLEQNPIQGFIINDTGLLSLYFAPDYISSGNITAVLRRAAIVKTLCQLEEVDSVELYLGTQPMMLANGKPMGLMRAEDFIDSTGAGTEFLQETQIVVYFATPDGAHLMDSSLKVTYDGKISTERLILNQLMEGPLTEEMLAVIPKEAVLNKISIKDGTCYVDFNEKFLEGRENVLPEVTIYSIVNSLTELSNVYKVQFLINGETRKTYKNLDIDFSSVFERNLEIIEGEQ